MSVNVFLADDHGVVRDGLRALLEAHADITVVGDAAGGQQAVERVPALQPDVVLMDISMPDLDGIEAAARIREAAPCVKIIFLSMLGTPEHVYRALQAGGSGFLLKESAGRQVVEAVLAVAGGDLYFSQPVTSTLVNDYLKVRRQPAPGCGPGVLSARERQILPLVVAGKTSAEIGTLLFLSPKTVESYRSRMMHKLGTPDMASLIRYAVEQGLV